MVCEFLVIIGTMLTLSLAVLFFFFTSSMMIDALTTIRTNTTCIFVYWWWWIVIDRKKGISYAGNRSAIGYNLVLWVDCSDYFGDNGVFHLSWLFPVSPRFKYLEEIRGFCIHSFDVWKCLTNSKSYTEIHNIYLWINSSKRQFLTIHRKGQIINKIRRTITTNNLLCLIDKNTKELTRVSTKYTKRSIPQLARIDLEDRSILVTGALHTQTKKENILMMIKWCNETCRCYIKHFYWTIIRATIHKNEND